MDTSQSFRYISPESQGYVRVRVSTRKLREIGVKSHYRYGAGSAVAYVRPGEGAIVEHLLNPWGKALFILGLPFAMFIEGIRQSPALITEIKRKLCQRRHGAFVQDTFRSDHRITLELAQLVKQSHTE